MLDPSLKNQNKPTGKYNTIEPEGVIPEKAEPNDSATSNDNADELLELESNFKANHSMIERDRFNSS